MTDTALLIIDIQNDYFPGGKMELHRAAAAAETAGRILDAFREKGWPIYHIQHESVRPGSTFFLPGTPGQQIHSRVAPGPGETVVVKHFPNSFAATGLGQQLADQGIQRLVITGMMTFMCVDATARAAKDLGFDVILIHDATAARGLAFDGKEVGAEAVQTAFLAALDMVCDQVVSAEAYLSV